MKKFPRRVLFWGADNMVTSFTIEVEDTKTGKKEQCALTTIMKLKRSNPFRTKDGNKRINVNLLKWSAKGFSQLLGKTIEYRLSKDIKQPLSFAVSKSKDEDFPASMTFNAIFDVLVDGNKVVSETKGIATANNLVRIPPDADDLFSVNKSVTFENIKITTFDCPSRFAITRKQKFLIRLGLLFRVVPEYFRTYLEI